MEGINWFNWLFWILDIIISAANFILNVLTWELPTVFTVGEWFFGGFEVNLLALYNLIMSTDLESISMLIVLGGSTLIVIIVLTLMKLIPVL